MLSSGGGPDVGSPRGEEGRPGMGMQATWGWVVPSGKASAALLVTFPGVDCTHKYSEDKESQFLPGREGVNKQKGRRLE